jgi:tetratricopeptide (TPR) repeat protein
MVVMGKIVMIIMLMIGSLSVDAQEDQSLLLEGNQLYKNRQYDKAIDHYQKATDKDEKNPKAKYNLGNALYRTKKNEAAQKAYTGAAEHAKDAGIKSRALYNKGVVYSNEKKLHESIDAYKDALKINPEDNQARENLQKALNELKKQQPPPKQDQKKQDQKNENEKQNNAPQNKSKLNQKQAERMLNALRQEEKKLQKDQQKKVNTGGLQEKDW